MDIGIKQPTTVLKNSQDYMYIYHFMTETNKFDCGKRELKL